MEVRQCCVREIRKLYKNGFTQHELASRFKISTGLVSNIVRGLHMPEAGGPITRDGWSRVLGPYTPAALRRRAQAGADSRAVEQDRIARETLRTRALERKRSRPVTNRGRKAGVRVEPVTAPVEHASEYLDDILDEVDGPIASGYSADPE